MRAGNFKLQPDGIACGFHSLFSPIDLCFHVSEILFPPFFFASIFLTLTTALFAIPMERVSSEEEEKTVLENQHQSAGASATGPRRASEQRGAQVGNAAFLARGAILSAVDEEQGLDSTLENQEDEIFSAPPNENQNFMDHVNQSSVASGIPEIPQQLPAQTVAAAMETEGTLEGIPVKYVTENGKRIIQVQERTLEKLKEDLSAQQAKDEEGAPTWKVFTCPRRLDFKGGALFMPLEMMLSRIIIFNESYRSSIDYKEYIDS